MAETAPFFWGGGGEKLSPEAIKRRRQIAASLVKGGSDYSPVQHWSQGLARVAQALVGGYEDRQLDKAENVNTAADAGIANSLVSQLFGGGQPGATQAASASPVNAGDATAPVNTATAPKDLLPVFARSEQQYGLPANYLAQTAGIESRFNPNAQNPNSSAAGLFQFIDSTAKQYGLANKFDPLAATDAAARLAADNAKVLSRTLQRAPTSGELYLAHQQGAGGAAKLLANPNARAVEIVGADAVRLNGGNANMTAGEFARRWTSKLASNEADIPAAGATPASMETGAPGFAIPGQPAPMDATTFNAISGGEAVQPVFQSEGLTQPWMGTALQPPAPAQPAMVAAPMPPARPADLAMAQADMPAPGAVPAIGQMPPAMTADLSNSPDAGSRTFATQQAQGASPFGGIAQALMGGGQAQTAASPMVAPAQSVAPAASPAVAQVAQALSSQPSEVVAQALVSDNPAIQRIAGLVLQQRLDAQKPRAPVAVGKDQRLVDPNTGRIILERDRNASDVKRSLSPIYGTDEKTGETILLQPGDDGSATRTVLPPGVKVSGGVEKTDLGTEWLLTDKRTGQVIGRQAKDLAGAERQKVEGKAAGEASTGLNDAIAKSEETLAAISGVRNHPGRSAWGAQGSTAAWPIIGNGLPGTEGRDFVARVDQLKGKSFLEAFSMLKGGGAISEVEGKTATEAIARLDRAQSKEGFDKALDDLEGVIRRGMGNARKKAGLSAPEPSQSSGGWNEVAPGVRIREKR